MFTCLPASTRPTTTTPPFFKGTRSADENTAWTLYAAEVPALSRIRLSLKSPLVETLPLTLEDFTVNCGRTKGSGAVVAVGGGIGVGAKTFSVAEPPIAPPVIEAVIA